VEKSGEGPHGGGAAALSQRIFFRVGRWTWARRWRCLASTRRGGVDGRNDKVYTDIYPEDCSAVR
jgi:hypothetical protein